MPTVAITAPTGCASINTAGLMDALRKTDRAWRMTRDPDADAVFEVRLTQQLAPPPLRQATALPTCGDVAPYRCLAPSGQPEACPVSPRPAVHW
ncbi:MAG TPA: hypothetical protein VG276_24055 [Actinomycetes bacterium]|jgi:hypothetical protein|nr:hypothetical protein [Actinomycetes bacterium]